MVYCVIKGATTLNPVTTPCPDEKLIEEMAQGLLPEPALSLSLIHLGGCESCKARFNSLLPDERFRFFDYVDLLDEPRMVVPDHLIHLTRATTAQAGEVDEAIAPETLFGPFQINSLIHEGLTTQVYQATDSRLNRQVAIKMLKRRIVELEPTLGSQFLDEARIVAKISHPNVVAIFDVGVLDERPYFVMPLLEGESLRTRLDRGAMSKTETCNLILSLIDGLKAAHRNGIIHKDLKPENLWLRPSGNGFFSLMIIDFGIAQMTNKSGGNVSGTPYYWSPEQVLKLVLDERTDFFAVGCVLFEMITGAAAWESDSIDVLRNPLEDKRLPEDIRSILGRLMTLDPEQRYPDHDSIMADVKKVLEPESAPLLPVKKPFFKIKTGIGTLVALLLAVLFFAVVYQRNRTPDSQVALVSKDLSSKSTADLPKVNSSPAVVQLTEIGKSIHLNPGRPFAASSSGMFAAVLAGGNRLVVFDSGSMAVGTKSLKDSEGAGRVWLNTQATMVASVTESPEQNSLVLKVWRIDPSNNDAEVPIFWSEVFDRRVIYDCAWTMIDKAPVLVLAMDRSQIRHYRMGMLQSNRPQMETINYGYSVVNNLYAHPDEPLVIASKNRGGLDFLDLRKNSIQFSFRAFEKGPPAVAWLSDGFGLIAISPDGLTIRYDRRNFVERSAKGHAYLIGQPIVSLMVKVKKVFALSDKEFLVLDEEKNSNHLKLMNLVEQAKFVKLEVPVSQIQDVVKLTGNKIAIVSKDYLIRTFKIDAK